MKLGAEIGTVTEIVSRFAHREPPPLPTFNHFGAPENNDGIAPYPLLIDGLGIEEASEFIHIPEPPKKQNQLYAISNSATETILHTANTIRDKAENLVDNHPVITTAIVAAGLAGFQIMLDRLSSDNPPGPEPLSV